MPKPKRLPGVHHDRAGDTPEPAPRPLIVRLLETPHLEQVVPRLQPEVLHRVIERCGLEDCGPLVALATPAQLVRVLDLDLWRTDQAGLDEQFDADRFGVWLEVLLESGADVAAQAVARMDANLVIAGLAQHALVFDAAAVAPSSSDDDWETADAHEGIVGNVGGYKVVATRTDSWDAIVQVLIALDAEHSLYFHRVMRGCRSLSNSKPEVDGLDDLLTDGDQAIFDVALSRERRRDTQGYVTPAEARGFLQLSRQLQLGRGSAPPDNTVARAYFRSIAWTTETDASDEPLPALQGAPAPEHVDGAVAAASVGDVLDLLLEEGVLPQPPRALLGGPEGPALRLARIQAHLRDSDAALYATRSQELAYLANTLVAGCPIQGRPFTVEEASDAALAICNLGLENWPPHWAAGDLVSAFQTGWAVLHNNVSLYAADRLIKVLARLRHPDRETQVGLTALRVEMTKQWKAGTPWLAREALEVIEILDMPTWAALACLMDECPVMHAGIAASRDSRIRAVSASAFEFISENSQIASVHAFVDSIPERLRP